MILPNTPRLNFDTGKAIKESKGEVLANIKGVVYAAEFPNGKYYVGKTTKKLKDRVRNHITKAYFSGGKTKIERAIRKYGHKEIYWKILLHSTAEDKLNDMEIHYIKHYDTYKDGYNMTLGGDGSSGIKFPRELIMKRAKASAETRRGSKLSLSHRKSLSLAKKGKLGIRPGHKASEETKLKISQAQNHKKRKVICVTTGEVFDSITETAKAHDIDKANLQRNLRFFELPEYSQYIRIRGLRYALLEDHESIEKIKKGIINPFGVLRSAFVYGAFPDGSKTETLPIKKFCEKHSIKRGLVNYYVRTGNFCKWLGMDIVKVKAV